MISRGLIRCFAWLPFFVLWRVADLLYVILYYVVRYRRRLVTANLRGAFPEMGDAELRRVRRRFYRNFADYVVETVKLAHISDAGMRRRFTFSGVEMIDDCLASGRSVVAYFSHCGNWEWAPSVTLWSRMRPGKDAMFCQVYRPLRNRGFDRLMLWLRGRFGSVSYPKKSVLRDLLRLRAQGMPSVTGFMSDQKPSHGDPVHVVTFLNRPTYVITGTETLARKLDMAVVYWDMHKTGRGRYHIDVRVITDRPADIEPYGITDRYFAMLEETIRRDPAIWLWSHNRWKRKVAPEDLSH